jgi:hypothetical protein
MVNSRGNTEEKEQYWRYHNTQLEAILQNPNNKNSIYWHKNRYEYQCNRIEDPYMNPHSYAHLIFDEATKN